MPQRPCRRGETGAAAFNTLATCILIAILLSTGMTYYFRVIRLAREVALRYELANIRTAIVAPMTSKGHLYPSRVPCRFRGKTGMVVLDQIRTVDHSRLVRKLGRLDRRTSGTVLSVLAEMFAP